MLYPCPDCGHPIAARTEICPSCGTSLIRPQMTAQVAIVVVVLLGAIMLVSLVGRSCGWKG